MIHSSYSPLFTLGLLADHSPSRSPSPVQPTSTTSSPQKSSHDDSASAVYFTFQTAKRASLELRSFLYLDLADNKPYVSSHKRKCSTLTKSTSWSCTADIKSLYDFARSEKPTMTLPSTPAVSIRRRKSKDSLRSIPSPKPAPSATLPELPIPPSPVIPPSTAPRPLKKRPASTIVSSLLSPSHPSRPVSLRSGSISSHDRRKSRMDALACLEGRSSAPNRIPRPSTLRKNFMSFSDDEDDKSMSRRSTKAPTTFSTQIEDLSAFADVEDEVDAIIPFLSRKHEEVDHTKSTRPTKPARKRRGTLESWFPLKSFIDFKDDDLSSWNWRSFIEIGGVS